MALAFSTYLNTSRQSKKMRRSKKLWDKPLITPSGGIAIKYLLGRVDLYLERLELTLQQVLR